MEYQLHPPSAKAQSIEAVGKTDLLRDGFQSTVANQSTIHPLEHAQLVGHQHAHNAKMANLGRTQGVHMPLRINTELALASQPKRLPGLPESNLAVETLTGQDETIDFEDVLGRDEYEMEADLHDLVEARMGWKRL
eukprot:Clim_evm45s109 gene=Clim_evmTU45s109